MEDPKKPPEEDNQKRQSKDSGGSASTDKSKASSVSLKKSNRKSVALAQPESHRNEDNDERTSTGFILDDGIAGPSEDTSRNLQFQRMAEAPAAPSAGDRIENARKTENQEMGGMFPPSLIDVLQFLPPDAIKTVKLKRKRGRSRPKPEEKVRDPDKPPGPIAAKVVYLKAPPGLLPDDQELLPGSGEPGEQADTVEPEIRVSLPTGSDGQPLDSPAPDVDEYRGKEPMPVLLFVESVERLLKETNEDKEIEKRLNNLMDEHRGDTLRKLKNATKAKLPKYKFTDMIQTLNKVGIPCPTTEDFARLHGLHSRWDPDGTVIEYFSPMLRSFIPINMRGRYRGSWPTDTCMKGLNISKVPPKRDAMEGFVDRGRHVNIQEKYDLMSEVASDEAHLDYLIEMQAFQAETLPIPIFYDMLHLGMQVANECLRILVQEEGYPPNNDIFSSQLQHAEQLRRKIQLYGALGLETLESKRRGLGEYLSHWLKTRDEIVRDIMVAKDANRYDKLEKKEDEAKERETMRRQSEQLGVGLGPPEKSTRISNESVNSSRAVGSKTSSSWKGRVNKVQPMVAFVPTKPPPVKKSGVHHKP